MYSTTITLSSNTLKGAGRNPVKGKKKGGIKVHIIIASDENVPQFLRFTSAATHDNILLSRSLKTIQTFNIQQIKSDNIWKYLQ